MKNLLLLVAALLTATSHAQSPGSLTILDPIDAMSNGLLRYGVNVTEFHLPCEDTNQAVLEGKNLTITANRAAGGATWSWRYKKYEFLNRHDYGRLFQGAIFSQTLERTPMLQLVMSAYIPDLPIQYNPTEAGSGVRIKGNEPLYGSPCTELVVADGRMKTSAVPLDFFPADFNGDRGSVYTTRCKPVIYPNVIIGKEIVLNALDVSDGASPDLPVVTEYVTKYFVPVALDIQDPKIERDYNTPSRTTSFYLTGKMKNSYIQYFPNSSDVTPDPEKSVGSAHSGAGSGDYSYYVMREDPVNNMAFGIYIRKGVAGVTQVQTPSPDVGLDAGEPEDNSTGILQVYNTGIVPAGWSEMRILVVCGPTPQVRQALRNIWYHVEMGVSIKKIYPYAPPSGSTSNARTREKLRFRG